APRSSDSRHVHLLHAPLAPDRRGGDVEQQSCAERLRCPADVVEALVAAARGPPGVQSVATIAMAVWPEPGHASSVARLFRQLKASGHETYVLGLPDFRELSTARGLDFVTFGEQAFPRDSLPTENPMNAFFRSARRYRAFVDAWIAAFARHRPAILLAD